MRGLFCCDFVLIWGPFTPCGGGGGGGFFGLPPRTKIFVGAYVCNPQTFNNLTLNELCRATDLSPMLLLEMSHSLLLSQSRFPRCSPNTSLNPLIIADLLLAIILHPNLNINHGSFPFA